MTAATAAKIAHASLLSDDDLAEGVLDMQATQGFLHLSRNKVNDLERRGEFKSFYLDGCNKRFFPKVQLRRFLKRQAERSEGIKQQPQAFRDRNATRRASKAGT